jgi:hypothetical protein
VVASQPAIGAGRWKIVVRFMVYDRVFFQEAWMSGVNHEEFKHRFLPLKPWEEEGDFEPQEA